MHGQNDVVEDGKYHREYKEEILQNVTENMRAKLLIYTGTLTAGVDFSEEHYHAFVAVFM